MIDYNYGKSNTNPFEINFGGSQVTNNTFEETITINGVKYKKVEDTKMVVKETLTAKTVTYKDKTYLRVEESNYRGSTDWWEQYGVNYMSKVSDINLRIELDREYLNQHQIINFNLNNPYSYATEGGGGTVNTTDFNFNTSDFKIS